MPIEYFEILSICCCFVVVVALDASRIALIIFVILLSLNTRFAAHPRSVPCAGDGAVTRMRYSPEAVEEAGKTAGANVVPIRPVS